MSKAEVPLAWLAVFATTMSCAVADVLDVPSAEYPTIQSAIDASINGDEIVVAPGTYNESISFAGKAILLRSAAGPFFTTIDATGLSDSVVRCDQSEGPNTVLQGFTLTGGIGNNALGSRVGGGMFIFLASPRVTGCLFVSNSATLGGAVYVINSSPVIASCVFVDNSAGTEGGAINSFLSGIVVTNCSFFGNTAVVGGGISVSGIGTTVTNSILWGNSDDSGSGESAQLHVIDGSIAVSYSLIQGLDTFALGVGNLGVDPKFVNALGGDLRLLPGSPAIDAGSNSGPGLPLFDLAGLLRRIDDGTVLDTGAGDPPIVDIGAFEAPGDCNGNGTPDELEPDGDGDGVIDGCDTCPGTPPGADTGLSGCPLIHNITQNTLFPTIQTAINASIPGDTIEVLPGTYQEAIDLLGRAITLRSTGGPAVTVIDASPLGSTVILCDSGEGPDTIIEGFTITGGTATQGGGMLNDGTSPTLLNCTFAANDGDFGAGMYNTGGGAPRIVNCKFIDNRTSATGAGGGMANVESAPIVVNSVFRNNFGGFGGGGMYNRSASPMVSGCTIYANDAGSFGGGVLNDIDSFPTVTNCILWANTDASGAESSAQFRVLAGDPVLEFSCIQGGWIGAGGTGNIFIDPLLVDPMGGDFQLSADSPCIDAGSNMGFLIAAAPVGVSVDRDGNPRFVDDSSTPDSGVGLGLIIDMGAHEFGALTADFDQNGTVDLFDFAKFLEMFTGP